MAHLPEITVDPHAPIEYRRAVYWARRARRARRITALVKRRQALYGTIK